MLCSKRVGGGGVKNRLGGLHYGKRVGGRGTEVRLSSSWPHSSKMKRKALTFQ